MTDQPFVLGVNYWPRRKAMYWWNNFDAGEVDDEFAVIQELGMSVVRLFLLWDDFQPQPDMVDKAVLANLVKVADIAAAHNLGLDVTFFTGHMSGPNWAPRWLLQEREGFSSPYFGWVRQVVSQGKIVPGGNYRNMFSDPVALQAERLLLRTVVGALKDHPAIWMWNLGNEPDLFAWPENSAAGRAWTHEMVSLIKSIDPVHPVTVGTHGASLSQDNGLRIDTVHAETDLPVMHSYPMYVKWSRQPLDPDYVPFTVALTASLSGGKPTLMEEFGGCTSLQGHPSETWTWTGYGRQYEQFMASEEDFAEYIRLCLPRIQGVGSTGAMIWCFADYAPELWDMPPCSESRHERHFGFVRPDGTLKPHAQVIKDFAATQPIIKPIPDYAKIQISPAEFYREDPGELLPGLYQKYLAALEDR
jgi:endo-1,4-beta-mannosidase